MESPFDAGYLRIAQLDDLELNTPKIFRAAGAMIVVRRDQDRVSAVDGSCFADDRDLSSEALLQKILECVSGASGAPPEDWGELEARAGLPTRVENGDVWVCVERCRGT